MATVSNLDSDTVNSSFNVIPFASGWKCYFRAMASPCEILIGACTETEARRLSLLAWTEVKRIEQKFSRYRDDNIVFKINTSQGKAIKIDEETHRLLTFSDQCYKASDGLFDITSGVLRKVWAFNADAVIPSQAEIEDVLPFVGWKNVKWDSHSIQLKPMMELDFGGIGKEYAADRVLLLLTESNHQPYLVNLGGDIASNGALFSEHEWKVGVEAISDKLVNNLLHLKEGAIATSGDSRRYLLSNGIRYSHILNPKTGWPIENAPHSITVMAPSCVQAGILSSLALLQGKNAESFLDDMSVQYWSQR